MKNPQSRSKIAAILMRSLLLIPFSSSLLAAVDYGSLDPNAMPPGGFPNTTWSDPGGWTTINVTTQGLPANNATIDAAQKVRDIIAATSGNRILYFPTGSYFFKTNLAIATSNIRLKGNGKTNTTFVIDAPAASVANIGFLGSTSGSTLSVTSTLTAGVTTATLSSASTINAGDFIWLYASNWTIDGTNGVVGQLFKVNSKSGNTLTLDMPLGVDIGATRTPVVQKLTMVSNVGVEDAKILRVRDNADYSSSVEFRYVHNARAINLDCVLSANVHLKTVYAKNVVFEGNDLHNGYDFGGGGHGYGVDIAYSTAVRISNNKTWDLRHQILLQKGASYCVISYNSSHEPNYGYNVICLHGKYPHNNLVEGNRARYHMVTDTAHGANGPRNIYFRNYSWEKSIGNAEPNTPNNGIVGNVMEYMVAEGANNYIGANNLNGVIDWGVLNSSSTIPPSLYTSTKPAFLGSKPWPIYGPGVDANWGTSNTLPATDRSGSGVGPFLEAESLTTTVSSGDGQNDYTDAAASNGYFNSGNLNAVNDYVEYTVNVPETGYYKVYVGDRIASNKGVYQLTIGGVNQGAPVSQYSATLGFRETNLGGVIFTTTGNKLFRFKVTAPGTGGGHTLGFDYFDLVKN